MRSLVPSRNSKKLQRHVSDQEADAYSARCKYQIPVEHEDPDRNPGEEPHDRRNGDKRESEHLPERAEKVAEAVGALRYDRNGHREAVQGLPSPVANALDFQTRLEERIGFNSLRVIDYETHMRSFHRPLTLA
jgi:hypothetical protein